VAGGVAAAAATAVPGWRRQLELSRREQRRLLWLGGVAVLANWAYLLARSG